jgi:hypothetical protein
VFFFKGWRFTISLKGGRSRGSVNRDEKKKWNKQTKQKQI